MRLCLEQLGQRIMPDAALAVSFAVNVAPALQAINEQFVTTFATFLQTDLAMASYAQASWGNAQTLSQLQTLQAAAVQVLPAMAQSIASFPQLMLATENLLLYVPSNGNNVSLLDTLMSAVGQAQQELATEVSQWQTLRSI